MRDDVRVNHTVIPIHSEESCEGRPPLHVVEPVLVGDETQLQRVVAALKPQVDRVFDTDMPMGAWLRGLHLAAGESTLTLAPDLGCRGFAVATIAFDTMRLLLPDTDIYVGTGAPA
jgi:hypothetical protein